MVGSKLFQCSVVTPEQAVLDCEATFVAFPSHDGEVGVLFNRAPLLHKMGCGRLRVQTAAGEELVFFVDGGFARMEENHLTLLTEQAVPAEEIDADAAKQALAEAQAMPAIDEASSTARQRAVTRARAQLRIAR
jgi:F-type H+-transporting ATPase subunit epsilon